MWVLFRSKNLTKIRSELEIIFKISEVDLQASYSIEKPSRTNIHTKDVASFDLNSTPYHVMLAAGPVNTTSHQVQYHTEKVVTPTPVFFAKFNPFIKPSIYLGCNENVGCEGLPVGCVASRNCSILLRYEAVAEESSQFNLTGTAAGGTYLAIGLSMDDKMGDDSVVACIPDGGQGVVMYWNVVGNSLPLPNTTVGVSNGSASLENGMMTCSFLLQGTTSYLTF